MDGDLIADRLEDEVGWLRQVASWVQQLDTGAYPLVVRRPEGDWPDTDNVAVNLARVAAVLDRVAAYVVAELARARRVQELGPAEIRADRRSERRRRLADPAPTALDFATFCRPKRMPNSGPRQLERAWDAWQAERYRRGEINQHPAYTDNPFRPR